MELQADDSVSDSFAPFRGHIRVVCPLSPKVWGKGVLVVRLRGSTLAGICCREVNGRCDPSTNHSKPPASYVGNQAGSVCRDTRTAAEVSVTVRPSLITEGTA